MNRAVAQNRFEEGAPRVAWPHDAHNDGEDDTPRRLDGRIATDMDLDVLHAAAKHNVGVVVS